MRHKKIRIDILLCEISIVLVSACLLFLSTLLVVNIYTIYLSSNVDAADSSRYLSNTTIKTIEVCKYDLHLCAKMR